MSLHAGSLNDRVMKIKNSKEEINSFIQEYKPFIAASVEKYTHKYVSYGCDDELSIGLIAFEEAVRCYDSSKGSFLSFAQGVIQRRLIDFYRKEKKHQNVIYMNEAYANNLEQDEVQEHLIAADEAVSKYQEQEVNNIRRIELQQLKEDLHKWELTFSDIAKSSPKHMATKKAYLDIIRFILDNRDIANKMKVKLYLPIAEIEAGTKIPRKTVERARNYVIAAVLILTGDYYCIREFIDWGWNK